MRIGITERGDAGLDLSWYDKTGNCDGLIAITKNITYGFAEKILDLNRRGYPCIIHATCTGWGKTVIEPNVPDYKTQLMGVRKLIYYGFPEDRIVLRIDPIIPSVQGLNKVRDVITHAAELGINLDKIRIRISIIDEYRHVKERFRALGLNTIYPGSQFYASPENFEYVRQQLKQIQTDIKNTYGYSIKFYCCAEPALTDPDLFVQAGCVSQIDLNLLGLEYKTDFTNPQNRSGCMCLGCKTELLTRKTRCPHQCIYCYWRD